MSKTMLEAADEFRTACLALRDVVWKQWRPYIERLVMWLGSRLG